MVVILTESRSMPVSLQNAGNSFKRCIVGGAAEGLARQVLGFGDRTVGLGRDDEGRPVVEDCDGDRQVLGASRRQLDQGVDVAKTDVVGAVGDHRHTGGGAVALVEGDVDAFVAKIAAIVGEEEIALRPLVFPVEDHLEPGLGAGRPGDRGAGQERKRRRLPGSGVKLLEAWSCVVLRL